ncbi:hypothetical protein BCR33DRAFT_713132 [Rhizoclosmatium globosum]|uniref:Uncharacterized protein n=1 Tax=Rhizoclosmatium globosum TaxID=329046 RepID=A0A1Y2CTJ6_9FUNG|nr:hypothetical protein BCR33DRAFT_713132 [Rhizoclosmatium globosum]|eukprot:ORY50312.1 hypothetical protein BCR33DRAFT_713132 [Rhizoclosmatium globosum]
MKTRENKATLTAPCPPPPSEPLPSIPPTFNPGPPPSDPLPPIPLTATGTPALSAAPLLPKWRRKDHRQSAPVLNSLTLNIDLLALSAQSPRPMPKSAKSSKSTVSSYSSKSSKTERSIKSAKSGGKSASKSASTMDGFERELVYLPPSNSEVLSPILKTANSIRSLDEYKITFKSPSPSVPQFNHANLPILLE